MIRAIARQATAEGTRRAKIINAEGRAAGGAEAARSRPKPGAGESLSKTFDQDQDQKIKLSTIEDSINAQFL
jgi:regulator of protease activity HflC (stomatin/prohibitin superfamily)